MKILIIFTILFAFYSWKSVSQAQPDVITDEEIDTMKIKDLRAFLKDRGTDCHGCAEKSDYVTSAKKAKHLPVVNERKEEPKQHQRKQQTDADEDDLMGNMDERLQKILREAKSEEGKVSFGSYWEEKAISICQKVRLERTGDLVSCSEYGSITSGIFRDMLKNMGSVLGKSDSQVLTISKQQPYLSAGERTLRKGYEALINPDNKGKELKPVVSKEISSWFLHTVMENPQSLYQGMDLDELMRTMKKDDKAGTPPIPPVPPKRPRAPPPRAPREKEEL